MNRPIFTGSAVAIATPFTEKGVNYDELTRLIEFNIANHTDAIVICGTTGESSTMTDEEHRDAIAFTVKQVNGRIPVIAGTGSNDTAYAVSMSEHAQEAGADALLTVTPYYNKATQHGLIAHFNAIADSVDIPMLLYDVPSRTGVGIAPKTYYELAKHKNIVGFKEASGNISDVAKTMSLCGDELTLYSGNDDQIVPVLSLGGKGVISVIANIMPKETHEICQLFFDGKVEESCKLQLKLLPLINALFIEVNPIPVKTALRLMGYQMGHLRLPLCDMLPEHLEVLKTEMKANGLI